MRGQLVLIRLAIARFCLIAWLVSTPVCPLRLAAQEIYFTFPEGHARIDHSWARSFPDAQQAMIWIVQDEQVQKELEIVDSQSRELERVFEEESAKLTRPLVANPGTLAQLNDSGEIPDPYEQLRIRVYDILLPHQEEGLVSIFCWSTFRNHGNSILAKYVADQSGVKLTDHDKHAIEEAQRRLDKEYLEFAANEYRSLVERTCERFPQFRDYLDTFTNATSLVSLDVLFADFQAIEELSPDDLPDSFVDLVRANRSGVISPHGNWQVVAPRNQQGWQEIRSLLLIRSGDFGGLITPEQSKEISIWGNATFSELREIDAEYQKRLNANIDPREAREFWKDANAQLDQKAMKHLENEILLPNQVNWLVEALRQRQINTYGLLGVLLMTVGPDGKEVSADERNDIKQFLKTGIATLKSNVTREFHKNVGQLVDELPESVRSEVKQRLGEPPGYLLPNLSMLAVRVKLVSGQVPQKSR